MRLSSVRIITGISCLFFAAAAWHVGSHSASDFTAEAQTAKPASAGATAAQLHPISASIPSTAKLALPPVAAPGTEIYTAKRGEAIPTIARRYLGRTSYLTSSELADAIRHANGDRTANILKANENIVIPGILAAPVTAKTIPVPKDFEVRAIYLTGIMAGSDHGLRIIRHWREVGGNAVVFDIKDSDGSVTIPFEHPLLGQHQVYLHDVPKFVRFLHQQNMHAIARIAIFRDERLVKEHPELAVQSRKNKQAWRESGKLVWTDPSQPKVQDYNIALAKHVAQLGADEIQFDYVRFPAEGDQKDAAFVYQSGQPEATQADNQASPAAVSNDSTCAIPAPKHHNKKGATGTETGQAPQFQKGPCPVAAKPAPRGPQRSDVITAFLKKAYAELHPTGVLFSLDVFGVMAWQRQVDLSHTGQDIVGMAHYCDVISPMIYPSHFFGMDGIAHPGDAPEHFIGESMDRFKLITKDSSVVIRPWLQAFAWRTKTYSPKYVQVQIEVAKQKGGIGFLFWNANNDYSKPYTAMPEMRAAKGRYFRGDEVGAKPEPAAAPAASSAAPAPVITPNAASSGDTPHRAQKIWRH